jgi:hypothetical protein
VRIILEASLSEPPSSVHCFRDVTLYASCFINADVLLECEKKLKDSYYKWLKSYGAYDFIDEIVSKDEEQGYRIGTYKASILVDRIVYDNLNIIIRNLSKFKNV